MEQVFAVIRTRGPAWNPGLALDQQTDWQPHAAFMNALFKDRFVLLVGPLEGTPDVLLIIRARDAGEIRSRLQQDPWSGHMLQIARIDPWTLRLGSL